MVIQKKKNDKKKKHATNPIDIEKISKYYEEF